MAVARLVNDQYRVLGMGPAGDPRTLLERLRGAGGEGGAVAGFDFPIGVPRAYAARAGIERFLDVLPHLGSGRWSAFFDLAATPEEISPQRPFDPRLRGGRRWEHLWSHLELRGAEELFRRCDRKSSTRRAACPLFWTLGGNQVGQAAISGWREVLGPALRRDRASIRVWPFDGSLPTLLAPEYLIVVETYPTEFHNALGIRFPPAPGEPTGKRVQASRRAVAGALIAACAAMGVTLTPRVAAVVEDGFGPSSQGEEPFDSLVGLLGMLRTILGHCPAGEPRDDPAVLNVEGWILGQQAEPAL
jgi:hypothetical protein